MLVAASRHRLKWFHDFILPVVGARCQGPLVTLLPASLLGSLFPWSTVKGRKPAAGPAGHCLDIRIRFVTLDAQGTAVGRSVDWTVGIVPELPPISHETLGNSPLV